MATNTQAVRKRIYIGLYLLARRQIHALGLGLGRSKEESVRPSQAETERPWAGVAEWLRAAHSLLDEKTVELTRSADR
jgi:hypothetical protein